MQIQINLDPAAISRLSKAIESAVQLTVDALRGDVISAQVMPFDQGDMQNKNTHTEVVRTGDTVIGALVTDESPQARRLYYHPEYNFQRANNPNARGLWYEPWISGERSGFAEEVFAAAYKKEAGL